MRNETWKKRLAFLGGIMLYVGLALLLSSYDNYTMHRSMNKALYKRFQTALAGKNDFKSYQISNSQNITGEAVTTPGAININQGDSSLTVEKWITHGGYSADEPEWLQSLRHFYDPLSIDGGAYHLTDNLPPGVGNPQVNSLDWSLEIDGEIMHGLGGKEGLAQFYSWRDGQNSLALALSEPDESERQRLMAHAWRCLGESMHCLADMVCPVHTRNDGHPPQYDADPYEDAIRGSKYVVSNPEMYWNQELIDYARSSDDIFQIYHRTALYTNENFFTNQTINGYGVERIKPVVRPTNPYPSPFAEESGGGWEYDILDFTFYKTINGQRIKMCKDRYYFAGIGTNYRTSKAYIDLDCAESQSKVLISNFLGVGPELMIKFLPIIDVQLESINADDESIWGFVEVKEGNGYEEDVVYETKVNIINLSTGKDVTTNAYGGGWYESDELQFAEGDQIQAQVSIGGLLVYSDKITVGGSIYEPYVRAADVAEIRLDLLKVIFDNGDVERISISNDISSPTFQDFSLNGNVLTIEAGYEQSEEMQYRKFICEFNESFDEISRISGQMDVVIDIPGNSLTEYHATFILEDIEYKFHSGLAGSSSGFIWYLEDNSTDLSEKLTSFDYSFYRLNRFTMESETKTSVDIDWSTPPAEVNAFSATFSKQ